MTKPNSTISTADVLFNREAVVSKDLLLTTSPARDSVVKPDRHTRRIFYPWDILLPASLAFWALGVRHTDTSHLGQYGLPAALPLVFYVGIALLIASIGWALARDRLSPVRLTANLGALLLMLYGTAPLLYGAARYSWTYKYIGVVQYINLHGHLNPSIDIYQNWPGFFAFAAWFDKVIGVQSPLAYAKWAQLAFESLTCLMLHFLFKALPLSDRERWLALFLYPASIWIAQDYFSAQALGVVLSTGIFALTLTFLRRETQAKWVVRLRKRLQPIGKLVRRKSPKTDEMAVLVNRPTSQSQEFAVLVAIGIIYFVLVFEHELSPYVVLIQLGALALIGEVRRRWIALLFAAVAFGYLAPHFDFVNSHFGILKSIGNFLGNATPPSAGQGNVPKGIIVSEEASRLLSVGMWGLSAIGALRRWRNGRPTLALVLLAYSPVFVFFLGGYGSEGILPRVSLFTPLDRMSGGLGSETARRECIKIGLVGRTPSSGRCNHIVHSRILRPRCRQCDAGERRAGRSRVLPIRPAGNNLLGGGQRSGNAQGRYNLFGSVFLYGPGGVIGGPKLLVSNAAGFTRLIEKYALNPDQPSYVLITKSMETYGDEYGFLSSSDLQNLRHMLSSAPGWFQAYNAHGVTVFELPPRA